MTQAALFIGLVILLQGVLGLAMPEAFVGIVQAFQTPPVVYLAAVIRVVFGVVLFLAAPASRMPVALRILGAAIVLGGLLTPLFGMQFSELVLGWWAHGGGALVRVWAAVSLVIGLFITYAVARRNRVA